VSRGYTKLFSSILASTVWREDHATRIIWITLLAMADSNGVAEGSIPGLADFARVTIAECEAALTKLSSNDAYSRSKEHGGRRICEVDGGWQILNHAKYRAKMNADERREYLRAKQAEHRQRQQSAVNTASTNVNNRQQKSTLSTQPEPEPEPEPEAEPEAEQRLRSSAAPSPRRQAVPASSVIRARATSSERRKLLDVEAQQLDQARTGLLLPDADAQDRRRPVPSDPPPLVAPAAAPATPQDARCCGERGSLRRGGPLQLACKLCRKSPTCVLRDEATH
jgi:hypothetical protein